MLFGSELLGLAPGRLHFWGAWLGAGARSLVRAIAQHSGVPVLVVAALLAVVGFRVLRKTLRFAVEVAVVAALLVAAAQLGWIRW